MNGVHKCALPILFVLFFVFFFFILGHCDLESRKDNKYDGVMGKKANVHK